MSSKIEELQGLRGIAILGVLVYHIWPGYFSNGFLGVDVFFTLSGYLMAVITLSKSSKTPFLQSLPDFYYRRIYRILPLYFINLAVTTLLIPSLIVSFNRDSFIADIKTALMFTTNFSMLFKNRNYFNHNYGFQWFKHYWSLSVELQFYLIVPLLFYWSKKLPTIVNLFLLWPALILGSIATMFYALVNYGELGAIFSFTMLPVRLSQFSAGIIAYYIQIFADELLKTYNCKYLKLFVKISRSTATVNVLALILVVIVLYPSKLEEAIFQSIIVAFTAALIATCKTDDSEKSNKVYRLIAIKPLVLIGNASYALYITHWAIVTLIQAKFEISDNGNKNLLLLCMAIGIAVHYWVEKPILQAKLKPTQFFTYILVFYICIVGYVTTIKETKEVSSRTQALFNSILTNTSQWPSIASTITPEVSIELAIHSHNIKCHYYPFSNYSLNSNYGFIGSEFQGFGKHRVLIIGNSHAECIVPAIKQVLEGQYSLLSSVVVGGLTPFEGFKYSTQIGHLKRAVKHYKPDIIFLVFKYQIDMEDPIIEDIDSDLHIQKMQEMIDFLVKNSKVVFISEKHFEVPGFDSIKFAENMYHNGWVSSMSIDQQIIESSHIVSTKRWPKIKCKTCIFMNLLQAYCSHQWCSPIDSTKKVPLLEDDNHLTIFGALALTPYLEKYWNDAQTLLMTT